MIDIHTLVCAYITDPKPPKWRRDAVDFSLSRAARTFTALVKEYHVHYSAALQGDTEAHPFLFSAQLLKSGPLWDRTIKSVGLEKARTKMQELGVDLQPFVDGALICRPRIIFRELPLVELGKLLRAEETTVTWDIRGKPLLAIHAVLCELIEHVEGGDALLLGKLYAKLETQFKFSEMKDQVDTTPPDLAPHERVVFADGNRPAFLMRLFADTGSISSELALPWVRPVRIDPKGNWVIRDDGLHPGSPTRVQDLRNDETFVASLLKAVGTMIDAGLMPADLTAISVTVVKGEIAFFPSKSGIVDLDVGVVEEFLYQIARCKVSLCHTWCKSSGLSMTEAALTLLRTLVATKPRPERLVEGVANICDTLETEDGLRIDASVIWMHLPGELSKGGVVKRLPADDGEAVEQMVIDGMRAIFKPSS